MTLKNLFAKARELDGGGTLPSGSEAAFVAGHVEEFFYQRTVLTVDCSGSMSRQMAGGRTQMEATKLSGHAFVGRKHEMFKKDHRFNGEIAVVAFNDKVVGHVPLTPYAETSEIILPFLDGLTTDGGTDFEKPLLLAEEILSPSRNDDPEILNTIIHLSDGQADYPEEVVKRLKEHGVIIMTIGIGKSDTGEEAEVKRAVLEEMASIIDGDRLYRFITNSDDLINHFFSLAGSLSG